MSVLSGCRAENLRVRGLNSGRPSPGFRPRKLQATFDPGLPKKNK